MSLLASTTFSTGIDPQLAAIDIYNSVNSQEIINITPDIENIFLNATRSISFIPDVNALENLKIIKGKDLNGLKIDADALKDGILSSFSGAMGAFKSLPGDLQNKLLNVNGYNSLALTINGITNMVNGANLSTIRGLGELIRSLTGCPFPLGVFDRNANILLGSNILRQAYLYNMLGAYGAFISCIEDRYVGTGITRRSVPYIVNDSSIGLFKDIVNGPYVSEVKSYAPNIVSDFVSNFKLKPNTPTNQYSNLLDDCFDCFDKVDSNWNKYLNYKDFTSLNNASGDFNKLLDVGRGKINISIPNNLNNVNTSEIETKSLMFGLSNIVQNNNNLKSNVSSLIKKDFPFVL